MPKVGTGLPKAGKPKLGVVMSNLGKLDGVYGNEYLLSLRLEGDSSSSSSSSSSSDLGSWDVRLGTMNLYGS